MAEDIQVSILPAVRAVNAAIQHIPELTNIESFRANLRLNSICSWAYTIALNLSTKKDQNILAELTKPGSITEIKLSRTSGSRGELLNFQGLNNKTDLNQVEGSLALLTISGRCRGQVWEQTTHRSGTYSGDMFDSDFIDTWIDANSYLSVGGTNYVAAVKWAEPVALSGSNLGQPVSWLDKTAELYENSDFTGIPQTSIGEGNHSMLTSLQRGCAAQSLFFHLGGGRLVVFKPSGVDTTFTSAALQADISWRIPRANLITIEHTDSAASKNYTGIYANPSSINIYGLRELQLPSTAPVGSTLDAETIRRLVDSQGFLELLEEHGTNNSFITADVEVPFVDNMRFGVDWNLGSYVNVRGGGAYEFLNTNALLVSEVAITMERERGYSFRAGLGWRPNLKPDFKLTAESANANLVSE